MASTLKHPFSVYVCNSSEGIQDESNISSFRFERSDVPSWEDMKAMIKAQYDIQENILLKHIDAEHEEITVGSQEEWKLAVKTAEKESNQLFLKMFILPVETVEPQAQRSSGHRCMKHKRESLKSHIQNINSKVENLSKELSSVKITQQKQQEELLRHNTNVPANTTTDGERVVVHEDTICSVCRQLISGYRFKCVNCSQFNLCENCEKAPSSERMHPETHVFLKITIPLDREIDAFISKTPLIACNLYEISSVERYMRKMFNRSRHRRHSNGSDTSSSSSSGSSTDSMDSEGYLRQEMERRRNRRKRHGRTGSASTSTHDNRRRRKYRRHRSITPSSRSSSGSSSGSSSSGSSRSASIVTLEHSSKRRRCSVEACRYGRHHKGKPCKRHQSHIHRRHDNHDRETCSSGRRHVGRRSHRHHHGRHRPRIVRESELLSHSCGSLPMPPIAMGDLDDNERHLTELAEWADSQNATSGREPMEQGRTRPTNEGIAKGVPRDGIQEVMMTDQEMQQFRARLNRLVNIPQESEPSQAASSSRPTTSMFGDQEYFVQTGCGLGDWQPIRDQSVNEKPTETSDSVSDFTLVGDETNVQEQQRLEEAKRRQQEIEEQEKRHLQQEEAKRRQQEMEEEEKRRQQQEEEERRQKQLLQEEEERRQQLELEEKRRQQLEDEIRQRKLEEEEERRNKEQQRDDNATAPNLLETESESLHAVIVDTTTGATAELSQSTEVTSKGDRDQSAEDSSATQEQSHQQQQQPPYQQYPISQPPQAYPIYPPAQYPMSGAGCPNPVYPYPAYPPMDGSTAANLWSATVNQTSEVLRNMRAGWQGFIATPPHGPAPAPAPEVRPYDYQTNKEMQQLVEMGFCNRELNQRLLEKYQNNVDRVVSELINESNDDWFSSRH